MIFKNIAHGDYQKRDMYAISLYKIINSLRKIKLKFAVFFYEKRFFLLRGEGVIDWGRAIG